jgi:hypothetical protein
MSSTRHAQAGSPFRQEQFASSIKQGLLANLVAKRCATIDRLESKAAVWFAQWRSWQPGGLVRLLREMRQSLGLPALEIDSEPEYVEGLERMCLDPHCTVDGAHDKFTDEFDDATVYPNDWRELEAYRAKWVSELPARVETSIGRRVAAALEYAQQSRTLTLIDGPARIGKSFAARGFCEDSAGLARYVQIPCSNDDSSFFRAIGRALGVSASLQLKAVEMRARVEEVLQAGDLTLVLDEAHYLWPQQWQRYASPSRVNWIMVSLVNCNVPVALVTTPQFYESQRRVERLTGWTSEQFIGRIGHIERLPDRLGRADLVKVAKALLPAADAATWGALAIYANMSKKHLASIEAIAKRATWLASQDGKQSASAAYVSRAMRESIIPSDTALADSLAPGRQARRSTVARLPRMARGYAAAAGPSIPTVDDPSTLITEPRGSLVTT